MMNKTLVLSIVLMAVIGLSGIAAAQTPRNMHKDDCNNGQGETHGHFAPSGDRPGVEKGKCDDKKDEDGNRCNNGQGETHSHFAPSGDRPGGEKGKCDGKKDEDDNRCNNIPGAASYDLAKNGNVCGHRAPGSDTLQT